MYDVDVWVAGWVYALAFFAPAHPIVILALALVDACAGDGAVAALAAAPGTRLQVKDLDLAMPSVGGLGVDLSMAQVDAEWQIATMPMGPTVVSLPVSRANDVIAQLHRGP